MKSFSKFFHISLSVVVAIAVIIPVFPVVAAAKPLQSLIKTAQASVAHPDGFQGTLRDYNCTQQEVSPWNTATPGGYFYTTDSNAKDPDCGRLNFITQDVSSVPANQSIYSEDFRVGIQIAESGNDNLTSCQPGQYTQQSSVVYTPWASEGGGTSASAFTQYPNNDPDCYLVYYETRALPAGILIKDVQFGVSLGNGAMSFTPWARQGGGWSGYSGGGNIKPARIQMNVQFVDVYDAQYSADSIPNTMNVGQSGNYDITMQNKATTWISDNQPQDSCQTQTPTSEGQTCQTTVNVSSNTIRLKRVDSDTGITSPATGTKLVYQRSVTRTYTASLVCVQWGVTYNDQEKHHFSLIKHAEALMPIEDDPGDPGDPPGSPTCTGYGLQYSLSSQTPSNLNVINTDTTSFPLSVTVAAGASAGIHTLQFKMVQTDTSGNEISTGTYQGAFATPFNINITVGTNYTLSCDATHSVTSGTTAQYVVSAVGSPSGLVTVTMSSNPSGPIMTNSPMGLGGKAGYSGNALVSTTGVPAGTYILTFTGTDQTPTTVTCQSQLLVTDNTPLVDLKFNNSDNPVVLQDQTSGTASWTTTNAASCTATADPALGSSDWTGSVGPSSGSKSVSGFAYGSSYTLSLDCVNNSGVHAIDYVYVSAQATNPTATLRCDQGGGNYTTGPCAVQSGSSGYLEWSSAFATGCSLNNGIGSVPLNQNTPFSTGNLSANTSYTLTCSGATGTTPATSSVTFNILTPPQKPGGPTTDNSSTCNSIIVNWTYSGSPAADGFEVYWSTTSSTGPWNLISPAISDPSHLDGTVRTFTHNTPAASSNYYLVRAYHDGVSVDSNAVGPVGKIACAPNIVKSDKDVTQVQRGTSIIHTAGAAMSDCNGDGTGANPDIFKLPGDGLFRTGDIVYFKINVCNTGNQTLTGITVTDTLSNLTSPSAAEFSPNNCASGTYPNFTVSSIAAPVAPQVAKECSITFSAKVTAPSGPSALYRFQNTADIKSDQGNITVFTPPYLFQVGAGTPTRTESNK